MLSIKFIRENADIVRKAVIDKQLVGTVDIDKLLELDVRYLSTLQQVEIKRNLKNQLSADVSKIKDKHEREKLIEEAKYTKNDLDKLEEELKLQKAEIDNMMLWVPNVPASDVPIGKGEDDNVEVRKVGKHPDFKFKPKDHIELGKNLNMFDLDRGAKIGGFRGYFLINEGVDLHRAILQYSLDLIKSKGFDIYEVPWMVRPEFFVGTGYFPWGNEDHYMTQDELALIGTAEVSLTSFYADEILNEEDLPKKLAGISPCYRREVGSYGKDTKGVFRVHQFTKVEEVVLLPEGEDLTREWHEKMLGYAEEVLKNIGLSYHVLLMNTGDMGAGQRKKYDIETWFPSQEKYRETHSDSYFLDFQARRLNIRYKAKDGKVKFVNTLNNTVAASPRLMAAVMENYQKEDGSIVVPECLRKYTGFDEIKIKPQTR